MPSEKTLLRKAVDYLILMGKIKNDNDLLTQLGYSSRGSFSEYLSGKKKTPPKLLADIENMFSISLKNLEQLDSNNLLQTDPKYVHELEQHLHFAKEQLQFLQTTVKANLDAISDNVIVGRAEVRAKIEYDALKDAQGDFDKKDAIMEQINKLIGLQLTGGRAKSSSSADGR